MKRPENLDDHPHVTVIVPARNEERNIGPCLEAVLASDYPRLDVVVTNDASTDRTEDIVRAVMERDPRVRLSPLPCASRDGWKSGKSFVLYHAVQALPPRDDRLLLFIDADVRLYRDALWRATTFMQKHGLLAFSGSGIYPAPSFLAELLESMMYTFTFLYMPLRKINDPKAKEAWLNGQFILIDEHTYHRVGGHKAVREFGFDDLSFGHHLKKQGVPFRFLPAAKLFECINYTTLDEAMRGWERLLAGGTPWLGLDHKFFMALVGELALMWLVPPTVLSLIVSGLVPNVGIGPFSLASLALSQVLFVLIVHALNRKGMGVPVSRAPLYPISALLALPTVLKGYRARYLSRVFDFRGRAMAPDPVPAV